MDIIVCFDIGTVGTGYAFSSRREYEKDMLDVHLNEEWMSGHANLHTFKVGFVLYIYLMSCRMEIRHSLGKMSNEFV